jgi:hypothetical protein
VVIWYIFPRFGILDQEKSGNPVFGLHFGRQVFLTKASGHPDERRRRKTDFLMKQSLLATITFMQRDPSTDLLDNPTYTKSGHNQSCVKVPASHTIGRALLPIPHRWLLTFSFSSV